MKIPSQSITRKISRLLEAVAIFMDRGRWYAPTARDDVIGEVSDSAVKPLVVSLLPRKESRSVSIARFGCRVIWDPTAALPLLCIKRRRFPICVPPPFPRAKPVTPAPLRPQGVTLQPLSSPTPSLSPVGSSLLGREPPVESMGRFRGRVIRISIAAERLIPSISISASISSDGG